jgi:hypothetical protein
MSSLTIRRWRSSFFSTPKHLGRLCPNGLGQ